MKKALFSSTKVMYPFSLFCRYAQSTLSASSAAESTPILPLS
jgi:hypothetical protein